MRGALAALAFALASCGVSLPPGGILTHPKVHLVFWGTSWDAADYQTRWSALLAGPCLDRLAEYGNTGADFVGPAYQADAPPLNVSLDGNIPNALDTYFREGTVAAPSGEDVYLVFLPTGATTRELTVSGAVGYHTASEYHGTWFTFAVIRDVGTVDIIASHELYESITDPYGTGVHVDGGLGSDEVGDVCEGKYEWFGDTAVQQVWSVAQGKCL